MRARFHSFKSRRPPRIGPVLAFLTLLASAVCAARAASQDPVSQLQHRLDLGQAALTFDNQHGYLASALRLLRVPVESQGLVFSKTSFQPARISPQTPRAVYFNDDVYVGWVQQGPVLEIASVDPAEGAVFYTLPQKKVAHPRFVRETASCLECHQSSLTHDLPAFLMRSVYPDSQGMPALANGSFVTTDQSPMKERWGGWYVDGKIADMGMANAYLKNPDHSDQLTAAPMRDSFNSRPYLCAHGDVVALLVLAHQTHLHNLLSQARAQTLAALKDEQLMRQMMKDAGPAHFDSTLDRIKSACEPLVQGMLFSGDPPLNGPVSGSTDFARQFQSRGVKDSHGRSLRDFDLHKRLFRYPCSYLIYSAQFDALPDLARQYVYRRLWKVLTGRDDSPAFTALTDADDAAVYEIIRQTKANLPAYWKPMN